MFAIAAWERESLEHEDLFTRKPMKSKLPPAIPDGNISCLEHSFYEICDIEAQNIFARRVVSRFRRSSKIVLEGQVILDV